jgi:hypothetical protein
MGRNMSNGGTGEISFREIILRDPLSDVTRKERSYSLGISLAGIVMVRTDLVPSRITTLGITFQETDRKTLFFLVGLVAAYFLVAFLLYGIADILRQRAAVEAHRISANRAIRAAEREYSSHELDSIGRKAYDRLVVLVRLVFEYLLPVALGTYAVVVLLNRALPL